MSPPKAAIRPESCQVRKKFTVLRLIVILIAFVASRDGRAFPSPSYFVRTIPNDTWKKALYGDASYEGWFSTHFRLSRKTFKKLVTLIRPHVTPRSSRGRVGRPLEFRVMCTLAYFSSSGDMRFPASLMGFPIGWWPRKVTKIYTFFEGHCKFVSSWFSCFNVISSFVEFFQTFSVL